MHSVLYSRKIASEPTPHRLCNSQVDRTQFGQVSASRSIPEHFRREISPFDHLSVATSTIDGHSSLLQQNPQAGARKKAQLGGKEFAPLSASSAVPLHLCKKSLFLTMWIQS